MRTLWITTHTLLLSPPTYIRAEIWVTVTFNGRRSCKHVKMNEIVLFVLVGFASGTIALGADEFGTPWSNLILGKEDEVNLCNNDKEDCSGNLSFLKNNLKQLDYLNLLQTDAVANKRGQSRLVEFGSVHSCSCGMDRHIRYLGQSYFPQRVLSGKCQLTCRAGSQMCRPKYYPLMVLKIKDLEDGGELNASANVIHSNLKGSWTTENINVVVSCECGP